MAVLHRLLAHSRNWQRHLSGYHRQPDRHQSIHDMGSLQFNRFVTIDVIHDLSSVSSVSGSDAYDRPRNQI